MDIKKNNSRKYDTLSHVVNYQFLKYRNNKKQLFQRNLIQK